MALGKTIAEVQATISIRELDLWGKYFRKYGSLNPVRMYDAGAATVAATVIRANGGDATPKDFLVYGKTVDEDGSEIVGADEFMNHLAKLSNAKVVR